LNPFYRTSAGGSPGESAGEVPVDAVVVAHGRPVNGDKTVEFRATLTPANQS
jgi:hypothetical protein